VREEEKEKEEEILIGRVAITQTGKAAPMVPPFSQGFAQPVERPRESFKISGKSNT
jgi:hypothetical protein